MKFDSPTLSSFLVMYPNLLFFALIPTSFYLNKIFHDSDSLYQLQIFIPIFNPKSFYPSHFFSRMAPYREQKIKVLVQSVANALNVVLVDSPAAGGQAGDALSKV